MVISSKYYKYLKSVKWKKLRLRLFKSRGRKCERCGETKRLHVHHKTYIRIFKEHLKDLEVLCHTCHRSEHKLNKK